MYTGKMLFTQWKQTKIMNSALAYIIYVSKQNPKFGNLISPN